MSQRPWMPLYVADYREKTRALSLAEHGAYQLLMMEQWSSGELPNDDARLARILGCSVEEWLAVRPGIRRYFDENWSNKRVAEEISKTKALSEIRSKARRGIGNKPRSGRMTKVLRDNIQMIEQRTAQTGEQTQQQNDDNTTHTSHSTLHTSQSTPHTPQNEAAAPPAPRSRSRAKPKGPAPPVVASRMSESTPMSTRNTDDAMAEGLTQLEAAKYWKEFRDYWAAVPGSKGLKSNWDATWRNRCRVVAERLGRQPKDQLPLSQPHQRTIEQWQALLKVYAATTNWPEGCGPAPGEPGCQVPEELLLDGEPPQ